MNGITGVNRLSRLAQRIVPSAFKGRVAALLLPTWMDNQTPNYFDRTFENFVRQGLRRNELLFACIQATANAAASVALRVHRRADDTHLHDHPLQRLLMQPNPHFSEFDLWSLTISYLKLAGRAYYQKVRGAAGEVVQLWPLRPDYVQPIRSSTDFISGYRYSPPGTDAVTLDAHDVLSFKIHDPLDLYGSLAPVEVAARIIDVDNAITDWLKLFMEHGASPQGILTSKLKLNDNAVSDILRRWEARYGGVANWGKPAVLDSDATYQKIGLGLNEIKISELDGHIETRICMAMQVPPIIVNSTFGYSRATYNNFESARTQWWSDVLVPDFKRLADTINTQLAAEFSSESVYVRWDFSKVPALQEDQDSRWQRATAAYQAGLLTLNDARRELGLSDLGTPGDRFMDGKHVQEATIEEQVVSNGE